MNQPTPVPPPDWLPGAWDRISSSEALRVALGAHQQGLQLTEVFASQAALMFVAGIESNHPAPLIRDLRDNFTSDELATFVREFGSLVRSIDTRHLITTGHSAPRPSAMHLLRAVRSGAPPDWTPDTAGELKEYLRLVNPDPVDVISIHYSDDSMVSLGGSLGTPDNLRFFAQAATEIGKPLFVGEIGPYSRFAGYNTAAALDELRATLPVLEELKLPLVMYWAFAPDLSLPQFRLLALRYGKTDQALGLIEAASAEISG